MLGCFPAAYQAPAGRPRSNITQGDCLPAPAPPSARPRAVPPLVSLVFALAVQSGQKHNIHAGLQPQNARCANSPFTTGDIFPAKSGGPITQISKITNEHAIVVGWTFRTERGGTFVEVNHYMSEPDQAQIGLHLSKSDRVSPIFPFTNNPWHNLRVQVCEPSEMRLGKYAPWRPNY